MLPFSYVFYAGLMFKISFGYYLLVISKKVTQFQKNLIRTYETNKNYFRSGC